MDKSTSIHIIANIHINGVKTNGISGTKNKIDDKLTGGTVGESEQTTTTTETYKQAGSSMEVDLTFWAKSYMSTNNFKEDIYYSMFINNGSNRNYWLASRYVATYYSSNTHWGLRYVLDGDVNGYHLFASYGEELSKYLYACPIVTLPSSVIDTGGGYNSSTGWGIK